MSLEVISVISAILVGVATLALAIVTYLYLRQSNKLIEISNRPKVLLYSQHGNVIIENIGRQTAFNIRFDTKTPNFREYEKGPTIGEWDWYKDGVRMLPPQKGEIRHNPNDNGPLIAQPPCEVKITYYTEANKRGRKYKDTTYVGSYPGGYTLYSQFPLKFQGH